MILRQTKKFIQFSAALNTCVATCAAIIATTPDRFTRRQRLAKTVSFYSGIALKILGIELSVKGFIPDGPILIVANHMSYIDVFCISSVIHSSFVTSVEIKETAGLGQLTELGGCLYVERRDKSNLKNEIKDVTQALEHGLNVCVFPEATSTDGSEVIRFRRPLFKAAQEASKQILPITINYNKIDGQTVDVKTRDFLCWYGDMGFMPHFLKMLTLKKIEISLDIHEPMTIANDEEYESIANRAHDIVAKGFRSLGATSRPEHSAAQ